MPSTDYARALELRNRLVEVTLAWEAELGVGPRVTSAISEVDAARLVGCRYDEYCQFMSGRTAVSSGHDFELDGVRYQVKANRPSGKPGSRVTLTPGVKNFEWDHLVWILYAQDYAIEEAWIWSVGDFVKEFEPGERLSPEKMRRGDRLYPPTDDSVAVAPPGSSAAKPRTVVAASPVGPAADRGALAERVASPAGVAVSRWNGDDVKGRNAHHGAVPAARDPFFVELSWKRAGREAEPLGCFRLRQAALLEAGYIREDRAPGYNRIRFHHDGAGGIAIQASADGPRLEIADLQD